MEELKKIVGEIEGADNSAAEIRKRTYGTSETAAFKPIKSS